MNLVFDAKRLLLSVSKDLRSKLEQIANQHDLPTASTRALTFNFRDTSYSAESGAGIRLKSVSSKKMVNGVLAISLTLAM